MVMSFAIGRWLLVSWNDGGSGVVNVRSCIDNEELLKIGDEVTITKRGGSSRTGILVAASDDRKSLQQRISQTVKDEKNPENSEDDFEESKSTSSSWASDEQNLQNISDTDDEEPLKKRIKRDYTRRPTLSNSSVCYTPDSNEVNSNLIDVIIPIDSGEQNNTNGGLIKGINGTESNDENNRRDITNTNDEVSHDISTDSQRSKDSKSNGKFTFKGKVRPNLTVELNRKTLAYIKEEIKELEALGIDFKKEVDALRETVKRTLSVKGTSQCSIVLQNQKKLPFNVINKIISPVNTTTEGEISDIIIEKQAAQINMSTTSISSTRRKKLKRIRKSQTEKFNSSSEECEKQMNKSDIKNALNQSQEITLDDALGIQTAKLSEKKNILNILHGFHEKYKKISKIANPGNLDSINISSTSKSPFVKYSNSRIPANSIVSKTIKSKRKLKIPKLGSSIPKMPGLLCGTFEYKLNSKTGIVERKPKYTVIYEGRKFDIPTSSSIEGPSEDGRLHLCEVPVNISTPNISRMSDNKEDSSSSSSDDKMDATVEIGSGQTTVPWHVIKSIDWDNHELATRKLLTGVFPRSVLATHSLIENKESKGPPFLDQTKIDDIISTIVTHCDVTKKQVRNAIIKKCLDESNLKKKMYCTSMKIRNSTRFSSTPHFKALHQEAMTSQNNSRRSSGEGSIILNNSVSTKHN